MPPSYDVSLGSAHCDIISDDEEFDLFCLARVESSVLFLCQAKIEDIARVISGEMT